MKSTGNDIVALKAIDIQRTTSTAFYSKFITDAEQSLYLQPQFAAVPFQNFIWMLWSVKEAAYKYLKRANHDLIFSPSKIILQNIAVPEAVTTPDLINGVWESDDNATEVFYTGQVLYENHQLYFRSKITTAFITSVVHSLPDFAGVFWGIQFIDNTGSQNQSKQVRTFALKKLQSVLALDNLLIGESVVGYPLFLQATRAIDIPLSLAHHNHFVAYSFILGQ